MQKAGCGHHAKYQNDNCTVMLLSPPSAKREREKKKKDHMEFMICKLIYTFTLSANTFGSIVLTIQILHAQVENANNARQRTQATCHYWEAMMMRMANPHNHSAR